MNLNFKSTFDLNPEQIAKYFDELDFSHQPNWKGCYCRFYHNDLPFEQWMRRTAEDNRLEMIESLKNHSMHGLMALEDDKIIAWLNINDIEKYARIYPNVPEKLKKQKIACPICFMCIPIIEEKALRQRCWNTRLNTMQSLIMTHSLRFLYQVPVLQVIVDLNPCMQN